MKFSAIHKIPSYGFYMKMRSIIFGRNSENSKIETAGFI